MPKNRGVLPPDYTHFKVKVTADGVSTVANIPASETKYKKDKNVFLDLTGGDTEVALKWTNDKWKRGVYDANIQFRRIRLKRVGKSERSGLSAFIGGSSTQGKSMIIGMILLLGTLGLVFNFVVNQRKKRS